MIPHLQHLAQTTPSPHTAAILRALLAGGAVTQEDLGTFLDNRRAAEYLADLRHHYILDFNRDAGVYHLRPPADWRWPVRRVWPIVRQPALAYPNELVEALCGASAQPLSSPQVAVAVPPVAVAMRQHPPVAATSRPRLNVETFSKENVERLNVSDARARVRDFVGETDYALHWERHHYIWQSQARMETVDRALRYCQAGLRTGEVKVRTTRGRMLWYYAQQFWADKNRAPQVETRNSSLPIPKPHASI